jgi:hypothetical protein
MHSAQDLPTAAPTELRYERTVPRSLVHVRAVSEVFTTDSAQIGPDEYAIAVQLPRVHTLWSDRQYRFHDPLISMEVSRQSAFQIMHQHYEVPPSWHFILRWLEFNVRDLEAYADDRRSPPEGHCRGRLLDRTRGDGFVTMEFEGDLTLRGAVAMSMSGAIHGMRDAEYDLLRGQSRGRKDLAAAAPPPSGGRLDRELVGRGDQNNVVLVDGGEVGEQEFRYVLFVDEGHAAFFDHPHDHVTGSLILEFYRQAAIATACRVRGLAPSTAIVLRCALTFLDFAELEAETECTARVVSEPDGGAVTVAVELRQLGKDLGNAELTLASSETAMPGGSGV